MLPAQEAAAPCEPRCWRHSAAAWPREDAHAGAPGLSVPHAQQAQEWTCAVAVPGCDTLAGGAAAAGAGPTVPIKYLLAMHLLLYAVPVVEHSKARRWLQAVVCFSCVCPTVLERVHPAL